MTTNENPWLGLKSYEENDRLYGRQKESDELANIVINSFHTIIYGKSGIGKTSLLRAGVFPSLRYEDFMPIYIRLEHKENAEEDYYLSQIEEIVGETDINETHGCWETHGCASLQDIFSSAKFSKSRGIELMPVFVFDQFEEIFTLNENKDSEAVNRFFSDLSEILNNDNDGLNYRIVICLREDYLYYIERLSESIPAFKRNRYCLQDLTRDEALEVITQPSPGMVDDAVAQEILRKLSPDNAGEVNATILSLYMSQLYDKMVKNGSAVLTSSLVLQFGDDIISTFYFNSIEGVSERSIEYLEDHLVTTGGYRHNIPLEDAIVAGVKQNELDRLKERRIINIQPRQGNVFYMEYAHDVLCPIIVRNREKRLLRKKTKRLRRIGAAWVVFVVILTAIVGGFILQNRRVTQERDNMKLMQSRAIAVQAEQLYKEGNYGKGVALCLRALPEELSNPERPISYEAITTLTKALYQNFAFCKKVIKHGEYMYSASFSPDGKYFVTSANDSTARIWSIETGKLVRVLKDNIEYVNNVRFSSDGKSVLECSGNDTVKIWDVATGKLTKTIDIKGAHRVQYSNDGRLIISSLFDKSIKIWNSETGKLLKTLRGHKGLIYGLSITHDGKYLVSYSLDSDHENFVMILWNIETGKQIHAIECGLYVPDVMIVPKAHIMATIFHEESGISLWDMETGRLIKKIGDKMYDAAAISPDGSKIIAARRATESGEGGGMYIYDIKTGEEVMSMSKDVHFDKPSYSPDGKYIVVYTYDKECRKYTIWDARTGKYIKSIDSFDDDCFYHTAVFSPDGRYILTNEDGVALWDIMQEENVRCVDFDGREFEGSSNIVCPDEKNLLIAIGFGDTITIANAVTGEFVRSFPTGLDNPYITGLSPDAHYVTLHISEGGKDFIQCWNTWNGECVHKSECHWTSVFSPDSRYVAYSHNVNTTIILDIATGKQTQAVKDSREIIPLSFSPDSKRIVTYFTSDSTIREYDVVTGKKVKVYDGKCSRTFSATFTSDGKKLATVSNGKNVKLWDVATGKMEQKIKYDAEGGGFVSFSPDDRFMIITAAGIVDSHIMCVWEVETGRKIAELNIPVSYYASFTPDGRYIVATRLNAAFVCRFFEPQEVIDYFRKVAGDYHFTPEEEIKYYLR